MRRYPAYDPPEYVNWEPDAELVSAYRDRVDGDPGLRWFVEHLEDGALLALYRGLLRFRLHDIALKRWVKQGITSKAWLGTGEEAVTVGAVHALRRGAGGDVVAPMIRNAGACHEMGLPIADMLRAYLGTADGPTGGRDLHLGSGSSGVIAPVSMVGSVATVVNGYALAFRRQHEDRVAMTWIGDGSTKTGEVHEALNFAAVQRLPVVFVIQNNQVALGTRLEQHHRGEGFSKWGAAYGMRSRTVDGNHVLEVLAATAGAVEDCRRGEGPAMIVAETFRMGGHATHDEREAREMLDASLFARWGRRDPIGLYEEYLATVPRLLGYDADPGGTETRGLTPGSGDTESWNRHVLEDIERKTTREVERAAEEALHSRDSAPAEAGPAELADCYG